MNKLGIPTELKEEKTQKISFSKTEYLSLGNILFTIVFYVNKKLQK